MALHSLQHLMRGLKHQQTFKSHQRFERLLSLWPSIVGEVVASKTEPLALQQDVLKVGVCNAVWAQNLAYERQRILDKLNERSPDLALTDIRFSTTQWHSKKRQGSSLVNGDANESEEMLEVWRSHPSRIDEYCSIEKNSHTAYSSPLSGVPGSPEDAFQQWAERIRRRSQCLQLCPQCRCPTPKGELERWRMCGLCAASYWAATSPKL